MTCSCSPGHEFQPKITMLLSCYKHSLRAHTTSLGISYEKPSSQSLQITAQILTQISSFQIHLEHLTVSSALVQRYNSQGELSTSNNKKAVQTVALGREKNISEALPAFLESVWLNKCKLLPCNKVKQHKLQVRCSLRYQRDDKASQGSSSTNLTWKQRSGWKHSFL